jgi:hypothetical protein
MDDDLSKPEDTPEENNAEAAKEEEEVFILNKY